MSFEEFLAEQAETIRETSARAGITRFGLSPSDFAPSLYDSLARYAPRASGREAREFLLSLSLEDLGLALGCSRNIEAAWEEFHTLYRRFLMEVAGDEEPAAEVMAELFATRTGAGVISRYRGRSSLKGWLRAIVHQALIDRHRREWRMTQLDALPAEPAAEDPPEQFERRENAAALARALREAVGTLPAPEQLLLRLYYQEDLRLAQIARVQRVHESTISRALEAIRKRLRKDVEKRLRREGFAAARIADCFRHSTDAPLDFERVFERARNSG